MSTLGRVVLGGCFLVAAALGPSPARAESAVQSNLDLMKTLSTRVVEELVSGFPSDAVPRELRLVPLGRDERYDFLGNVLAGSLTSMGYRAYASAASPADSAGSASLSGAAAGRAGLNIEYQLVDFTLRYPKVYRSFLIGGKNVKRSAGVRVLARLVDPADGLVVWTGEAAKSYDDHFSYGIIEDVEAGVYQFTKPPRDSRKWGKVVEPVVVSGIIVGLIYLFFSNQGD